MSIGLIALLDDVADIAKLAAASLDDVAAHTSRAAVKAAGVVIDDTAVTPRYVIGFAAERELPIIGRIAAGSLQNKLFYLLPAALILNALAPWTITPLLMLGGAFLCYEGTEKIYEVFCSPHARETAVAATDGKSPAHEDAIVRGAIRTDFILSAEIMAITLASISETSFWLQFTVLAVVGLCTTALVYGAVALIVKADDAGVLMVRSRRPLTQAFGRSLVCGMPVLLKSLGVIGTAAMLWVGGGIILHGLDMYGLEEPAHAMQVAATVAGKATPVAAGATEWAVAAGAAGMLGLLIGAALIPLVEYVMRPAWNQLTQTIWRRAQRKP